MILTVKTKILMIIAAVLFATTIGTGVYYISSGGTTLIEVSDFASMTKEEVLDWASQHKLSEDAISFQYEYDENAEADTVIAQSPAAGESLKPNDTLEITLSNGPDPALLVELIDLVGKTQDEAAKWLEQSGFTDIQYRFASDETAKPDTVLKTEPEAGRSIRRNERITLTICSGNAKDSESAEEVTVPDFSTYTRTNIQAWGSTNKVTIVFQTQSSNTIAKDKVISQTPRAGNKVKQGGSVTVTISSGKGLTVTSFVGKPKTEADAWIRQNGLKSVMTEVFSDSASGVILTQTPSSGSISAGGTVTFEYSGGLVPLSDYTGKSRSEFDTYIGNLNAQKNKSAKISVSYSEEESDSTAGTILSQSASGNVKPGTSITVKVAVGKKVTVADKRGVGEDSFRTYLSSLGLKPGNISYAYDDAIKAGALIRNDTGTYAVGSSISYTVSKGSYSFNYGSLINAGSSWSTLYNASSEARANGWSITSSSVESTTYDSGIITENCSVSGKSIACKVSSGKVVSVPNVTGLDKDSGITAMKNAGLNPNAVETGGYRDEPAGQIIGQSLAAGSSAKAGAAVTLTYSKGPKPVETAKLPNINIGLFDGRSESEIRNDLTDIFHNAGFANLNFVVVDTSQQDNDNGIESISPAPNGAVIDKTTTITIVIHSGKTN